MYLIVAVLNRLLYNWWNHKGESVQSFDISSSYDCKQMSRLKENVYGNICIKLKHYVEISEDAMPLSECGSWFVQLLHGSHCENHYMKRFLFSGYGGWGLPKLQYFSYSIVSGLNAIGFGDSRNVWFQMTYEIRWDDNFFSGTFLEASSLNMAGTNKWEDSLEKQAGVSVAVNRKIHRRCGKLFDKLVSAHT